MQRDPDRASVALLAEERIKPERDRLREEADKLYEERAKYPHGLLDRYNTLKADIEKLEAALGFKISGDWHGMGRIIKGAELAPCVREVAARLGLASQGRRPALPVRKREGPSNG